MTAPRSTRRRRRLGRLTAGLTVPLATLLVLALAAGCVSVPTDASVRRVDLGQREPDVQNTYAADPPRDGATPSEIVLGFLSAFAEGGPDEHDARLFLTQEQAATWDPDGSVLLTSVADPPELTRAPDGWRYDYPVVGQLSKGGTYSSNDAGGATSNTGTWKPELVEENGQWRISMPPNSILLPENRFAPLYHPYELFYWDATFSVLVPYPIFLRYEPSNPLTPAALLSKLIDPDASFRPARNLVAVDQTPQVRIGPDAIANVRFDFQAVPTDAQDRQRFAAQLLYTLTQLPQIDKIQINGGGYPVPAPSPAPSPTISTIGRDDFPGFAPLRQGEPATLYALTKEDGLVTLRDGRDGRPTAEPVPGAPDIPADEISSFAVSAAEDEIAIVDQGGSALSVFPLDGGPASAPPLVGEDMLRPQFTRFGEAWTVGTKNERSLLMLIDDDGGQQTPDSTDLGAGEVTAFRISPDGTRIAVIRKARNVDSLSVGSIDRSNPSAIAVVGLTRFPLYSGQQSKAPVIQDVTWLDPTTLLVLADNAPSTVAIDGTDSSSLGPAALWDVNQITAPASVDPSAPPAVVFKVDEQSWQFRNNRWTTYVKGLEFATYSG